MNGQNHNDKYIKGYRRQVRREMDAMGYPGGGNGEAADRSEAARRGWPTRAWQMSWSPASDLGPLMRWTG